MTLIDRVAMMTVDDSAWLALPPWGLYVPPPRILSSVVFDPIYHYAEGSPGFNSSENRQMGFRIPVSGRYVYDTPAEGLAFQWALRNKLRSSDGEAREIDFCRWVDSSETYMEVFRKCEVEEDVDFETLRAGDRAGDYRFVLRSMYAKGFADASDGSLPATNDYEAYYYSGDIGGAAGTEAEVTVETRDVGWIPIEFPGLVNAVTNASNLGSRQRSFILSADYDVKVLGIQIIAATPVDEDAAGSTIVRASDTSYATAGNGIQATLAAGAMVSASRTAGEFTVSAGSRLYVYIPSGGAGGGHGDVMALVDVEIQSDVS